MTDEDIDLERYGAWSPEAQELGLPSYKPAFLFLSVVPLEVIHEFLRMRLEQKPDKPSPLSLRQVIPSSLRSYLAKNTLNKFSVNARNERRY